MEDTFDRRQTLTEDDLWLKTVLIEYNLCLKMTFDGRCHIREDYVWWKTEVKNDLWWEMSFDRRQPLMKGTFDGSQPFDERESLMKDSIWGRQPLIKDDIWYYTQIFHIRSNFYWSLTSKTKSCFFLPPPFPVWKFIFQIQQILNAGAVDNVWALG